MNHYNVYFIYISYELITISFIYCTHTVLRTQWNQFIQFEITKLELHYKLLLESPTQFQEIKKNHQNPTIKSGLDQIFYVI